MTAGPPRITSARNDRVRAVRRLLTDPAERRRQDACVVEGIRVARDYLAGGGVPLLALVAPRLDALAGGPELRRAVAGALVGRSEDLLETTDEVLAAASDTKAPQGIVLVVRTPRRPGLPRAEGRPVLVAWELQDPGNVGSLIRTAEGAGCAAAVLACAPGGAIADASSPRAVRAAAGSTFRLPVHEWTGPPEDLARDLRAAGFRLAACVASGGMPPDAADLRGAVALCVGAETRGLPEALAGSGTLRLTIPLSGATESLNAGAAAAVIAFEAARQRRG